MSNNFSNTQYASALNGKSKSKTQEPQGRQADEFFNGAIEDEEYVEQEQYQTAQIEYARFASVRDRIYTDKAQTPGNVLMLVPANLQGVAQGMTSEIQARYPDAWGHYEDACKAGQVAQDSIFLVQAAARAWDANRGRATLLFKNGQIVLSRTIIGFVPVKDRFGSREAPSRATIEFAEPALSRLAEAAQAGRLSELGITEIRTPKLVKSQPWAQVAGVMLATLGATGLPVRIHLGAEDTEYDLDQDGNLVERVTPSVAPSGRIVGTL